MSHCQRLSIVTSLLKLTDFNLHFTADACQSVMNRSDVPEKLPEVQQQDVNNNYSTPKETAVRSSLHMFEVCEPVARDKQHGLHKACDGTNPVQDGMGMY
jgi:hypothetical protein